MNKKINTALAIAIIILISGALGALIWLNAKNVKNDSLAVPNAQSNQISTAEQQKIQEKIVSEQKVEPSSNDDKSQNTKIVLEQKIRKLYDISNVDQKNPAKIEYSLVNHDYDIDYSGPVNVEVKYKGKKIGSFSGTTNEYYIPVYENDDELFIISYCGGIGGMCRGNFIKYNIKTDKVTNIVSDTLDFFLTKDGKELILFAVNNDWLTFNLWTFDFDKKKLINQKVALKCSALSNIRKNCIDLFFQDKQEIIYVPMDYDDIKIGDAYKLTDSSNLSVTKFSVKLDALNQNNLIFPIFDK